MSFLRPASSGRHCYHSRDKNKKLGDRQRDPYAKMSPAATNELIPEIVMGGEPKGLPSFKSIEEHRQWIREHMAAAFRVIARQGLTEGVAGHMSVRDPEERHKFWMNP